MDYSYAFIEKYGHGKMESNDLQDDNKVTICDHDNHYYVYEADDDQEAQAIAEWFQTAADSESSCSFFSLHKNNARSFYLEVEDDEQPEA